MNVLHVSTVVSFAIIAPLSFCRALVIGRCQFPMSASYPIWLLSCGRKKEGRGNKIFVIPYDYCSEMSSRCPVPELERRRLRLLPPARVSSRHMESSFSSTQFQESNYTVFLGRRVLMHSRHYLKTEFVNVSCYHGRFRTKPFMKLTALRHS